MTTVQIKPYQRLAWLASAVLIASAVAASSNLYPWFIYGFLFSNVLWVLIGVLWREKSLIVMNTVLTIIYVIGLLT
jgi:hypothetical protein